MTREYALTQTTETIRTRVRELSEVLDGIIDDNWDTAYNEYCMLTAILDERYREETQEAFNAFYTEYIEGKSWEEISSEEWSYYSDWHKDMYGFRPKHI